MSQKRIMFAMLRTMGDVILGTTIARELRRDFPDARIVFYTDKAYEELLANNPHVDEVMALDQWHWNQLFLEMASGKYDAVYAPYQMRPECNSWHQREDTRHQHLVDFYWRRMGMHRPITERECYLFPSEEDHKKSEDMISFDVPRVVVHGTTGVPTKDWPLFDELVEDLRKAGYGTIQVGSTKDRQIKGAVDFRGKLKFLELAAFLSKCAAFVGLDSGISYMADAMKMPTIVIQGSTNPVTSGPISPRVVHLFAKETGYADCQTVRCHSNCRHEKNCIEKVSVNEVTDELDKILSKWKKPIPVAVA